MSTSSKSEAEPLQVLHEIFCALRSHKVPFVLGGSFASGVHGEFRATNDADIICSFTEESLANFLVDAASSFDLYEDAALEALKTGRSFNLIHKQTIFKADLFLRNDWFGQSQIQRATNLVVEP